jgi:hypothetical protein
MAGADGDLRDASDSKRRANELGSVEIHRELMTAAARLIIAA